MRAAVYARISSDPEDRRAGVDRQLERGADLAASKGWIVAESYVDNDLSGYKRTRRPGFDALKAAIADGSVDAVVVQHQDRIARNVTVFREFADLCRDHDIRIEAWAGPIEVRSATGRMTSTIQASVDEHQSAVTSEKVSAYAAEAARRGEPNGGRRPFGYERTRFEKSDDEKAAQKSGTDKTPREKPYIRTFQRHPTEATEVEAIFHAFANKRTPLRQIATALNERGIETAGGSRWSTNRVRDVLRNPIYIGMRVHRGEIIGEGNWEGLVDRAVYERAQRILNDPKRRTSPGGPRKYFLSGGIARCGRCDTALVSGTGNTGRRLYRCPPKSDGGCNRIVVDAAGLEAHVSELLLEVLADPQVADAMSAQGAQAPDHIAELADLDARRAGLAEGFAAGEIDKAQLVAGTAVLNERTQEIRQAAARADRPAFLADLLARTDLNELWSAQPAEWQHRVAGAVLDHVTVGSAHRGWNFFDPGRVTIEWAT